ncbi:hypothetical protein Pmani_031097 [Petrolisthes manimaculis]|uniref:Uncharacterized protein n=1 Tax=Petrolisthes manimaculis TaxID=1843537 RepID=A0AAE1NUC3_9EUCA|nr:hypothetical protein Pmani_031097 [Petrolisthes manimaculis]
MTRAENMTMEAEESEEKQSQEAICKYCTQEWIKRLVSCVWMAGLCGPLPLHAGGSIAGPGPGNCWSKTVQSLLSQETPSSTPGCERNCPGQCNGSS